MLGETKRKDQRADRVGQEATVMGIVYGNVVVTDIKI